MEFKYNYRDLLKTITTHTNFQSRIAAIRNIQYEEHYRIDRQYTMDTFVGLIRNQEIELCKEFIAVAIRPNLSYFTHIKFVKDDLLVSSINYINSQLVKEPDFTKLIFEKPLFIENCKEMLSVLRDLFLITKEDKKSAYFQKTLSQLSRCHVDEIKELYLDYIITHPDYSVVDKASLENYEELFNVIRKRDAINLSNKLEHTLPQVYLKDKRIKI